MPGAKAPSTLPVRPPLWDHPLPNKHTMTSEGQGSEGCTHHHDCNLPRVQDHYWTNDMNKEELYGALAFSLSLSLSVCLLLWSDRSACFNPIKSLVPSLIPCDLAPTCHRARLWCTTIVASKRSRVQINRINEAVWGFAASFLAYHVSLLRSFSAERNFKVSARRSFLGFAMSFMLCSSFLLNVPVYPALIFNI